MSDYFTPNYTDFISVTEFGVSGTRWMFKLSDIKSVKEETPLMCRIVFNDNTSILVSETFDKLRKVL